MAPAPQGPDGGPHRRIIVCGRPRDSKTARRVAEKRFSAGFARFGIAKRLLRRISRVHGPIRSLST